MRCGIGAPGPASVRVWQIMSRCRGPRGGRPPPAAGGRSCRLCSRDLTEALDQQTATAEILRVISSSPTDVQPVFDAIVQSALRLLDGFGANVARLVGEDLHLAALTTTDEAGNSALTAIFPMPISGWNIAARAVRARAPVYLDDTETDAEYRSRGAGLARARGVRSIVAVPMMSQNNVVGTIAVSRREPGSFSDEEIALLQTFADQAVIADRERAAVQGAGGADGRADPVGRAADGAGRGQSGGELDAGRRDGARHDRLPRQPAGRARAGCAIYEYDDGAEQFELRATHNDDPAFVEALRAAPLRKGEGLMGRAAEMREPIQIPDIASPGPTRAASGTRSSGSATGRSSPCPCSARTRSSAACP